MTNVIVTATGFKAGSRGRVMNTPEKAGEFFGTLPKGEVRRIRKQLHAAGKVNLAAAKRIAPSAVAA